MSENRHYSVDLTGKKVLVIGSGADLANRFMRDVIDKLPADGGEYDVVVRCNKMYGDPLDVGTRTDVAFVRYPEWLIKYNLTNAKHFVSVNGMQLGGRPASYYGDWNRREGDALCQEIGIAKASCGALAVNWAKQRGCTKRNLHVIGFGYDAEHDTFTAQKSYPDGRADMNPAYNWSRENEWLRNNATLL